MAFGTSLAEELWKLMIWGKGQKIEGLDPAKWRKDVYGAYMFYDDHGNRHSPFGWERDHINPLGGDGIDNMQRLQWENNVRKSDKRFPWGWPR